MKRAGIGPPTLCVCVCVCVCVRVCVSAWLESGRCSSSRGVNNHPFVHILGLLCVIQLCIK